MTGPVVCIASVPSESVVPGGAKKLFGHPARMQHWILATLIGIGLGLMLYGCVRLRIYAGPILRERIGNWARSAYWVLTIVAMVVLANFSLLTLRYLLAGLPEPPNSLLLEIWFALLAAGIALFLVFKRVTKDS